MSASGIFSSITRLFSPSENKDIMDRRQREEYMREIQFKLDNLRQGVLEFKQRRDYALKDMKKARDKGKNEEAKIAYNTYMACDDQVRNLNNMIKNLSGIEISMRGAEYSVGATDIIKNGSEFFLNIGQNIDPGSIDQNISKIMDQEIVMAEMRDQLSAPFSRSALEHNEPGESTLDVIDALISEDGSNRPKNKPTDEKLLDLPSVPRMSTEKISSKKSKKKKNLASKPLF